MSFRKISLEEKMIMIADCEVSLKELKMSLLAGALVSADHYRHDYQLVKQKCTSLAEVIRIDNEDAYTRVLAVINFLLEDLQDLFAKTEKTVIDFSDIESEAFVTYDLLIVDIMERINHVFFCLNKLTEMVLNDD
ncbi:hypothetical protein [Gynurincola endophyticus]|uniref:hypothetical protein n=1 Tax=Gynurincola endophyticus TaxID=2479004 RepID=UPI000F8F2518|nr:hypothetical protein [Gynurincola endophyticus]